MSVSVLNVLNNTNYNVDYVDENFTVLQTLSTKNIAAFKNELGAVQNLHIGATSNLYISADDSISTYVVGSGLVNLHATTLSNSRIDTEFLKFYYDSNDRATVIEAPHNKSIVFKSTDCNLIANISGLTLCNDLTHQEVSTIADLGFKVIGPGMQLSNLMATKHLFGKDLNVYERFPQNSNVGEIVEAGYGFRMNSNMHLELVKYNKEITASGYKDIYKCVMTFGGTPVNSNMNTDAIVGTYNPFADLSLLGCHI